MTCFNPISAWMHKTRKTNTGKSMVVFKPPSDIGNYRSIQVPCGQCIGCRLAYSQMWAVRCFHEMRLHAKNCFLTLTYDDEHVPWSSVTGEQTLHKRDLQLFWKSLRKKFPDVKIRYFAAGEYGDLSNRPHYHAIVFGFMPDDLVLIGLSRDGFYYYKSDILKEVWDNRGNVLVANCSFDTCAYVARYVLKKLNGDQGKEKYEGIEKEFCNMSRRPGIGAEWFKKHSGDVYPYDEVVICENGKTRMVRPPRYYDNLYDVGSHDSLLAIKEKRVANAERHAEENSVAGRLDQRAQFKNEQIKFCKRSVE